MQNRSKPCTMPAGNAGFTLIELLVVISIIAVLASMLMPAVSKALNSARNIQCANNLKGVGFALFNYAQDNDGYMPATGGKDVVVNGLLRDYARPWHYTEAYLKDDKLFFCPADKSNDQSYGWNVTPSYRYLDACGKSPKEQYSWPLSIITKPSQTIYMADSGGTWYAQTINWNDTWKGLAVRYRHMGGNFAEPPAYGDVSDILTEDGRANHLFHDSHVESLKHVDQINELWDGGVPL